MQAGGNTPAPKVHMSSITTKQGDGGETRLYSGETVSKKSKRVWACGDIDELVSMLGICWVNVTNFPKELVHNEGTIFLLDEIEYIQKKLFIVASEIATLEPKLSRLPERIDESSMAYLDTKRDMLEKSIELPKGFILPGNSFHRGTAYLDMARSMCRRCERTITDLYNEGFISNKYLLMYMNRLSDYLYLLARYAENKNYRMVK